jgi:diguanylate cyclase (GGDEF)-like protein
MGGVFGLARTALLHSFADIEDDATRQGLERVRRALEADLAQLEGGVLRGAHADPLYAAVVGRDPRAAAVTLGQEALRGAGADVLWISDAEGRTLIGVSLNASAPGGLAALGSEELAQLAHYAPNLEPSRTRAPLARLMRMPAGPMAFASAPIVRADHPGPPAGTLLYGRYLLTSESALNASQATALPMAVTPVGGDAVLKLPEQVRRWLASAPQAATPHLQLRDATMLRAYALLRDVAGAPLAVLSTGVHRGALARAKHTASLIVVSLAVGFGALVLALVVLVSRERLALRLQRRAHRRRLLRLARRDGLTGLPNRAFLQAHLPELLRQVEREDALLALLYIDLDNFKDVNDSLGHTAGDRLLTSAARRLRSCAASGDLVVRMGGDEFIVVAAGLQAVSSIDHIARRIEETLGAPLDIDGAPLKIIASIGISVYPNDGTNLEQLLKHADIALHEAKAHGRSNYQFFTGEMQARISERLELEQALRAALGTEQLCIEYQPSFDLQSKAPVGFEALARWHHPHLGLVPPARFIPIAEQSNLVLELGGWALRRVCRQLAEWQALGLPLLPVSVNVTSRQFEQGRLVETVAGLTREFGIDATLLQIEITESAAMHHPEQHLGTLQALRDLGTRILIDDFGTGYSSLSYLKHLPIDTLKIDRAFVRDMASDSNDAAIVSAIIGIARSLGLHVVAEGVETAEQVACLLRLGCHTAQGFYFSRPLTAAVARVLLERLGTRRRSADSPKLSVLRSPVGKT